MRRVFFLSAVFALCAALSAHAQFASSMAGIVSEEKATWGQVSYFSAVAQNLVSQDASEAEAFAAIQRAGIAGSGKTARTAITFAELAHVCARTWNIQDSLMYRIAHSPRYAFKMMQAKGLIPRSADPGALPSGRDVLNILRVTAEQAEGQKEAN